MATVALITEEGAAHQQPYRDAIRDLDIIERAELMDPGGATFADSMATVGGKAGGTHTTVDSLLAAGKPDMAIVTMIAAHAPDVIRPLLEAGVHVMAEKPACVNVGQFEELASLADANGAHLMLALANRISPSVEDARRIIQGDGVGDLYAVRAVQVDDQTRIQRRLNDPDWTFQKKLAGGGHLSWLGIHRLDMLSYLVGEDIAEVSAMTAVAGGAPIDVEDLGIVTFKFAGGALGVLFSGYLMDQKGHNGFTVYGSEGWVRAHEGEADALEWRSISPAMVGCNDRRFEYDGRGSGYLGWVERTLQACLGEIDPPITAEDGVKVLRVVHAAYASAESGSRVTL